MRQVFDTFMALHPLSQERFSPSRANLRRWEWHIQAAQVKKRYPAFIQDNSILDLIRNNRRVRSFNDFPEATALVYVLVASCFPGQQVWACGSRVRGDYMEDGDAPEILEARRLAGKSPKFSDFDFWVNSLADPIHPLPEKCDRARCRIPEFEKIPLPMWDFKKLPENEHARVIELLQTNDLAGLAEIHNKYQLSERHICCDLVTAQRWFAWAVTEGIIKSIPA